MFLVQMASYSIQEVHNWKEKLESIIDQVFLFFMSPSSVNNFLYFKFHKVHFLLDFEHKILKSMNVGCMQQQGSNSAHGNKYFSFEYRYGLDTGRNASSSDRE